jgi:tetratricopeptide (TPR) repeat protein
MACVAAAAIVFASFATRENPLLPLLGFFVLARFALLILMAAFPLLRPLFRGSPHPPEVTELDRARIRDATVTLVALCNNRRYHDALDVLNALGEAADHDPFLAMTRAWCYGRLDLPARAAETLEAFRDVGPAEPLIHYALACYLSGAGRVPAALDALSVAVELDPELRALLADEPAFEPIRGEDDFALLARGPSSPS